MILSNGCWLLWPLSFLIWAGKKSQQLSNLEAWGLLKLLSVAAIYWRFFQHHLNIEPTKKGIWKRHHWKASRQCSPTWPWKWSLSTTVESQILRYSALCIYIYKCGTPVVTGIWDVEESYLSIFLFVKIFQNTLDDRQNSGWNALYKSKQLIHSNLLSWSMRKLSLSHFRNPCFLTENGGRNPCAFGMNTPSFVVWCVDPMQWAHGF